MLPGELFELPWYRTIFTNIGDVISPEHSAAAGVDLAAVDVGELLGDDLSHGWWDSLLQKLARSPLAGEASRRCTLPRSRWTPSEPMPACNCWIGPRLIAGPEALSSGSAAARGRQRSDCRACAAVVSAILELAPASPLLIGHPWQLVRDIGRTRFRRKIWISLAAAEAIFLLVAIFKFQ